MRKQWDIQPPAFDAQTTPYSDENIVTQEREYKLITPLFGGGASPGEYDPVTIVRGTEIRGQLRFWWRACRGGQFKTVQALKDAEDKIWGKAHKKGDVTPVSSQTVQIVVDVPPWDEEIMKSKKLEAFTVIRNKDYKKPGDNLWKVRPNRESSIPAYAGFSLQPSGDQLRQKEKPEVTPVYKDVEFKLTIMYPATFTKDIQAALWAWETFGGVGARTRRGFGAIHLQKVTGGKRNLPSPGDFHLWMTRNLREYVVPQKHILAIPTLSQNLRYKVTYPNANPLIIWNSLIRKLSQFRQRTNQEQKWPETQAVKDLLMGKKLEPEQKFPKAAFGLPIVFQVENDNLTLEGAAKGHERLGSPLILKPLLCSNDKTVVGLAVLLEHQSLLPPEGVHLRMPDQKSISVQGELSKEDLQNIPFLTKTDMLQEFLDTIEGMR